MKSIRNIALLVIIPVGVLITLWTFAKPAAATSIDPFLGVYHGTAISEETHELKARDLDVTIKKTGNAFSIDWSTVIYKSDGREKASAISIDFFSTDRADIFGSAMRTGLFGKRVPNDPLKGQPFVWARIVGPTLTVHAMYILDDGGYEMQVYERTLDPHGNLDLVFKRFRNGKSIREITGELTRVK
ncbi:hypothetical protein [Thalassospira marina]|uniref:hypothetical protein n=1 Tax=Thalassospira marina TaxID=2048283 RepID=UPI001C06F279|nr:hypothetical protein [Thalassospira marina]